MSTTHISPEVARTRSRLGVASRRGDSAAIEAARRDHTAARLEDFIRRTVDAAPPLSLEQRQRLAALLSGGGLHGAA